MAENVGVESHNKTITTNYVVTCEDFKTIMSTTDCGHQANLLRNDYDVIHRCESFKFYLLIVYSRSSCG